MTDLFNEESANKAAAEAEKALVEALDAKVVEEPEVLGDAGVQMTVEDVLCDACRHSREHGWWGEFVASTDFHCRDCHVTTPGSHRWNHCRTCCNSFSGERAWNAHLLSKAGSESLCSVLDVNDATAADSSAIRVTSYDILNSKVTLIRREHDRGFTYWAVEQDEAQYDKLAEMRKAKP